MKKIAFIVIILTLTLNVFSQKIKIYGHISTYTGDALPNVILRTIDSKYFATSDPKGYYEIILPANKEFTFVISSMGFSSDTITVKTEEKSFERNFIMKSTDITLDPIEAIAHSINKSGMERLSTRNLSVLPDISGNAVETLIKTSMGVSSNNELSSQYNVRGGNFDENLIYVNGIEIYRPFLVRSGQQEGLSFINSDLVDDVQFSAGGFGAEYDDKMSSVLDVKYKKPIDFKASITAGILIQQAYLEGISKNNKFQYIAGIRHKESAYLLKTLEVKGDYKPKFSDFQTYLNYSFNNRLSISFLGNAASNIYNFEPTVSRSDFGSFSQRYTLNVAYDGKEQDKYNTLFGAVALQFMPKKNISLKLSNSFFYTDESEKFDILASYWLNEAASQADSTHSLGDSITNLGVGAYLSHARNFLNAAIYESSANIAISNGNNFFKAGIKYKREYIFDFLSEWKYIDSAGYSITPEHIQSDTALFIYKTIKGQNQMMTNRFNLYMLDAFDFKLNETKFKLTGGLRFSYNDYNNQFLVSPRFSALIEPNWSSKWFFRTSWGYYYQPPFYREIRMFDGTIVPNQKAQRAIHYVVGAYHTMKIWGRPFKFSTEIYYKDLDNIIPYEIENLRIRYYADQRAKGFAAGADFKLYGEFVPGTDSWVSLSFLKTMEDIIGDHYNVYYDKNGNVTYNKYEIVDTVTIYPGYIPRPSDQLMNFSFYFQDYVPGHENYKVNLTLFFGTPLPYGPPERGRYLATYRAGTPYIRADIGFSFLLKDPMREYPKGSFGSWFKSAWLQVEIFNFMGVRNIAGYDWVELVPNTSNPSPVYYQSVGIASHLTGRLLNFKLIVKF